MKTIHIYGIDQRDQFLKQWYRNFLKEDSRFHYVYWENMATHKAFMEGKHLLIRLEDKKVIDKLKRYLDSKELAYIEYDYPHTRKKYHLGLFKKSWEDRHFNISQKMDHLCSVAALELNYKDWGRFVQQFFHIACNTRGFNHFDQARLAFWLTENSMNTYHNWSLEKFEELIKKNEKTK